MLEVRSGYFFRIAVAAAVLLGRSYRVQIRRFKKFVEEGVVTTISQAAVGLSNGKIAVAVSRRPVRSVVG